MDFDNLLRNKTAPEITAIGENWYSRLNRLKDKYGSPLTGFSSDKSQRVIMEMYNRLGSYSKWRIEVRVSKGVERV